MDRSPCFRSSIVSGNLNVLLAPGSSSSSPEIFPLAFVSEAGVAGPGQSMAADMNRDELWTRSLNVTTPNSTVLAKLEIPGNGEKDPFLTVR